MRVSWSMIAVIALSVGAVGFSSSRPDHHIQSLAESDKKDDDKDDEEEGRAVLNDSFADDRCDHIVGSGKKDDEKKEEVSLLSCRGFCVASQNFQGSGRKENRRRRGPASHSQV